MSLSTFPCISPRSTMIKIPSFDTRVISYGGKNEQRISMEDDPQCLFKLKYSVLSISEADQIEAFFRTCKGKFTTFYLPSPDEVYRNKIWTPDTDCVLNEIVRPSTVNYHSYKVTTAGKSHATTEPTWTVTVNGTNTDNTITWTENTYTVRFKEDLINLEAMTWKLYNLGEIEFIEVSA